MTESVSSTNSSSNGGLIDDVIGIFTSPASVFARVRNSGFARPALIQSVIFIVLVLALRNLVSPYFDAEFERGMNAAAAKGQQIPESALAMSRKIAGFTALGGPVISPWFIAIFGGLLTFVAAKLLGAKLSYGQSAMIAAWSAFPSVIGYIAFAVQGALADTQALRGVSDGQIGPARFFDPTQVSPAVLSLLQSLDLFSIWSVVLTAIGVSVVAGVSRSTGAIVAIVRFGAVAAISLATSLMRG